MRERHKSFTFWNHQMKTLLKLKMNWGQMIRDYLLYLTNISFIRAVCWYHDGAFVFPHEAEKLNPRFSISVPDSEFEKQLSGKNVWFSNQMAFCFPSLSNYLTKIFAATNWVMGARRVLRVKITLQKKKFKCFVLLTNSLQLTA